MIGKKLRELREHANLTQTEMARFLGVTQAAYQRYETGERSVPDDIKNKLADYYHVSIDYLMGRSARQNDHILAAHRVGGIDDLPEEAQKQLDDYIEFLRNKYKK